MNPGEQMNAEKTFAALKPAVLDEMAEDGHARRREDDLARAMAAAPERARAPRRRPILLVAGATAAACTVTGTLVAVAGGGDGAPPAPPRAAEPTDAREFLLASANSALKAPHASGAYWYSGQVTSGLISGARTVVQDGRKVQRKISYRVYIRTPSEAWLPGVPGEKARKTSGAAKLAFPSAADEAKWRKDGSPNFLGGSNRPRFWEGPGALYLGNRKMTVKEMAALPTDPTALEKALRAQHARDRKDKANPYRGGFTGYVWQIGRDLLSGPTSPGTRSAMFTVLARQPGVRLAGKTTDALGRPGMAVQAESGPDGGAGAITDRLIIALKGGALLGWEAREGGRHRDATAYRLSGWVPALGARP